MKKTPPIDSPAEFQMRERNVDIFSNYKSIVTIATPRTMIFKLRESHPFAKLLSPDIPCSQRTESKCDLRLLDGNVGISNVSSKVVTNAITLIDNYKYSTIKPFQCLLGPSGCGKTKACFDVLKLRYDIYFDFSTPAGQEDVDEMKMHLDLLINEYPRSNIGTRKIKTQSEFEQESRRCVQLLLLSRLLILYSMLERDKISSPKEWLLFQLNGLPLLSKDVFLDLVSMEPFVVRDRIHYVLALLEKKSGEAIIIALDEPDVIADTELNWNSPIDTRGCIGKQEYVDIVQPSQPLCSLIVSAFSIDLGNSCPVLLLGTSLRLEDIPRIWFQSNLSVLEDPRIPLETRCEFDVFTMDDNMCVLQRLFSGMRDIDYRVTANKLQNLRPSVLMKFCEILIQCDSNIDPTEDIFTTILHLLKNFDK
jgi:hypothetical protein